MDIDPAVCILSSCFNDPIGLISFTRISRLSVRFLSTREEHGFVLFSWRILRKFRKNSGITSTEYLYYFILANLIYYTVSFWSFQLILNTSARERKTIKEEKEENKKNQRSRSDVVMTDSISSLNENVIRTCRCLACFSCTRTLGGDVVYNDHILQTILRSHGSTTFRVGFTTDNWHLVSEYCHRKYRIFDGGDDD